MPLYADYGGFWEHLPIHVLASFLGAAVTTWVIGLAYKILTDKTVRLFLLSFLGLVLVVVFEIVALEGGMRGYGPQMPLPWGKIGLLPVLQFVMLIPHAALFNRKIVGRTV